VDIPSSKKGRAQIKRFFVKNAIPTEGNFADLIEAGINQRDDGLLKDKDQPLTLVAAPGEQRRVLQLYGDYSAASPDWLIALNPKVPGAEDKTVAGLGVIDRKGKSRLVLDLNGNLTVTGDLSYGGVLSKLDVRENFSASVRVADFRLGHSARRGDPGRALVDRKETLVLNYGKDWPKAAVQSPLSVTGELDVGLPGGYGAWNRLVVNATGEWGDTGRKYATIGAGGASGIMLSNPHVTWRGNRASVRYGRTGGAAGKTWWDAGVRADGAFSFQAHDDGAVGETLKIAKDGAVTALKGAKLHHIGVGADPHGNLTHAYESIQLHPNHNLRIYFGTKQRCMLQNSGQFTIYFDKGRWVFQNDGNLVKYNSAGKALWALNKVNGHWNW
jgi:hypothetical protein